MMSESLIKAAAGNKTEQELKSLFRTIAKNNSREEGLAQIWEWYRVLCKVHTGSIYDTFSLQIKGDQERLEEWIKNEFGNEPIRRILSDDEKSRTRIEQLKELGLWNENFEPFIFFDSVSHLDNGDRIVHWISWFPNEQGELRPIIPKDSEKVRQWVSISDEHSDTDIILRVNAREEEFYRQRIKNVRLDKLKHQQEIWETLQRESPLKTPSGNLTLVHAPTVLLKDEIQKRLIEHALILEAPQKDSSSALLNKTAAQKSDNDLYALSQAVNGLIERIMRDLEKDGLRFSAIRDFVSYIIGVWKKEFNLTIFDYFGTELWDQNSITVPSEKVPELMKLLENKAYEEIENMLAKKDRIQQTKTVATTKKSKNDLVEELSSLPGYSRLNEIEKNKLRIDAEEIDGMIKKEPIKKKENKRKKIKLIDAARACKQMKLGRRKNDDMIDICTDFLKKNEIIGKPKYLPEKLSNYISQVKYKL